MIILEILIVEDNYEKAESVKQVFKSFSSINLNVVTNISDATALMVNIQYDLLILDMNLPYQDDDEPEDYSGYNLYREIRRGKALLKPKEIVILTAYDAIIEKYQSDISLGMVNIIKFDITQRTWKKQLENLVNYKLELKYTKSTNDFDIAIITAIEVEHTELKKIFNVIEEIKIPGDDTYYYKGCFEGSMDLKIVFATQHQKGIIAAGILATKMIQTFRPRYLIMVGIAAGIEGKAKIGDLLIPFEFFDYTSGKITSSLPPNDHDAFKFEPDPKYLDLDVEIKEVLNKDYSEILSEINTNILAQDNINIVKGSLACGPFVLQNQIVIDNFIKVHNRNIVGVDMESYGVLYAGKNAYHPKPRVIVCKAVSDFGDVNKSDSYQQLAAYNSVNFIKKFILKNLDLFQTQR